MKYYISLVLLLFSAPNFSSELNLISFLSSDKKFLLNAPADLKLEKVVYVKKEPKFVIYDAKKSEWFDFIIVEKSDYFVKNEKIAGVNNLYKTIFSSNVYKLIDFFELKNNDKPVGWRIAEKYIGKSNKTPAHYKIIDVYESGGFYYVLQIRDRQYSPEKIKLFIFCEKRECNDKYQKTLEIPDDFKN